MITRLKDPARTAALLPLPEVPFDGARVLDALPLHVALLQRDGTILYVNRAWRDFCHRNSGDPTRTGPGVNYFDHCGVGAAGSRVVAGMRSVAECRARRFTHEYPCHAPGRERWFRMTVVPYPARETGLSVVFHENITDARMLERLIQGRLDAEEQLLERSHASSESERSRAAAALDAKVAQGLAALRMDLVEIWDALDVDHDGNWPLARALQLLDTVTEATLEIEADLRPPMLDLIGLRPTLEWHVEHLGVDDPPEFEWRVDDAFGNGPPDLDQRLCLYRVAEEAIDNLLTHSGASHVVITMAADGAWELTIEDNGRGLPDPAPAPEESLGLLEMAQRLARLGGTLSLTSGADGGTRVRATLPRR